MSDITVPISAHTKLYINGELMGARSNRVLDSFFVDYNTSSSWTSSASLILGSSNVPTVDSMTTIQQHLQSTFPGAVDRFPGSIHSEPAPYRLESDNDYDVHEVTYRFAYGKGTVIGVLGEFALNFTNTHSRIHTRQIVTDKAGNPGVIDLTLDDQLTIEYTVKLYTYNKFKTKTITASIDGTDTQTEIRYGLYPYPTGVNMFKRIMGGIAYTGNTARYFADTLPVDRNADAPWAFGMDTGVRHSVSTVDNIKNVGVAFGMEEVNAYGRIGGLILYLNNSLGLGVQFTPPVVKDSSIEFNFNAKVRLARM